MLGLVGKPEDGKVKLCVDPRTIGSRRRTDPDKAASLIRPSKFLSNSRMGCGFLTTVCCCKTSLFCPWTRITLNYFFSFWMLKWGDSELGSQSLHWLQDFGMFGMFGEIFLIKAAANKDLLYNLFENKWPHDFYLGSTLHALHKGSVYTVVANKWMYFVSSAPHHPSKKPRKSLSSRPICAKNAPPVSVTRDWLAPKIKNWRGSNQDMNTQIRVSFCSISNSSLWRF